MAVIQLTVPDALLPTVVEALSTAGGYSSTLPDGTPNPQTAAQFAKAQIIAYVKQVVKNHEAQKAAAADVNIT